MSFTATKSGRGGTKEHRYTQFPHAVQQAKALIASKVTGDTITLRDDTTGQTYSEGSIRSL